MTSCDSFYKQHIILNLHAEPLAELRLPGNQVLGVGDRWVVVGKTSYDTKTRRLLRIVGKREWEYRPAATGGNHIVFPPGDSPRTVRRGPWVYAEMRRNR